MRLSLPILLLLLPFAAQALDLTIRIEGLDKELEANARAYLSIEQEKARESLTLSRLRLVHRRAPGEIENALQPFGYFRPVIESELETVDRPEGKTGYVARYRVDPGPAVRLDEVDVQLTGAGEETPALQLDFPLAVGDVLDQRLYEQGKKALESTALENGYLNARFRTQELKVDLDRYAASIRLLFDTGDHFRFGDVSFHQDVLDPAFVARYLRIEPGDPFDHKRLLRLQSRLIDSEYFRNVEVRTLRDEAVDNRVPVEIHLAANKRDRYRAGLGYSTDTGPRVTLDWRRRYVNKRGHRLNAETRFSPAQSFVQSEYIIPLERPSSDSVSFGATLDHEETDSRKETIALVEAGHSVGLEDGWRRTLKLSYSYEDYDVADEQDDAFLLVPSVQFKKVETDGLDWIQRGWSQSYRAEGAVEQLFSDTSYLTLATRQRFVYGFGEDWRFLTRAALGATWADELTDLPSSKRFFAGGDVSIRGWDLDELGPVDDEGRVVGGRYLGVASLELERRIVGRWSASAFVDAGNAFDPDYDSDVEYGAGVGVRWRSPVGPIRVDIAYPLTADDPEWRLHVVVGPDL